MSNFKETNFRSKKFLGFARDQDCWLNIRLVCRNDKETVVPCHSPDVERMHGKCGYNVKAHDIFSVPGCRACHDYIDNRSHFKISGVEKQQDFNRAHAKWIVHCLQTGKVKVV